MPVYTHVRQFPHLAGMADADIRELARRAMARRPDLVRVVRLRNAVGVVGMVAAAALLGRARGRPGVGGAMQDAGGAMMVVGAIATVALLLWNLVWVNTVLFRLTRDEVERSRA